MSRICQFIFLFFISAPAFALVNLALDDVYTVPAGSFLFVEAPGVLDNDQDPFGEDLSGSETAVLVDFSPAVGTLECTAGTHPGICSDGSFTYTPPNGYLGSVSFTYQIEHDGDLSNSATVTLNVTGCEGVAPLFTCWVESSYLAKLAELGYNTIYESFEDDVAWGTVRTGVNDTNTAPSVTSQGISWRSNFATNNITTGSGPARTGEWGFFSLPHGDQSATGTDFLRDGFIGDGSQVFGANGVYGVGGWISAGPSTGRINFILTRSDASFKQVATPDPSASNAMKFYGVIDTTGFDTFEVVEIEGKAEQMILVFSDDFNIATLSSIVNHPPYGVPDAYPVSAGSSINITVPGVLTNDYDPDGDPLEAELVDLPAHYTSFVFRADGSFGYTHAGDGSLSDNFSYRAIDGRGGASSPVPVDLTIGCSANHLQISQSRFTAGTTSCIGNLSISAGPDVVVEPGATLILHSPRTGINGNMSINTGAVFAVRPD